MQPRNKREEKMLAWLDRGIPARFTNRQGRRRLVWAGGGVLGLLWAGAVVAWVLAPSTTAMVICLSLLGIAALAGWWVAGNLVRSTRGVMTLPPHLLDEWHARQRVHAYAKAQRLTLFVVFVTCLIVLFAMPDDPHGGIPNAALAFVFLSLLVTVAALPLLTAAWEMPDTPAEEDGNDGNDVNASSGTL
jgi:hypothetical protein